MKLWPFPTKSTPDDFWRWFVANEAQLRTLESDVMITKIGKQLARIHKDLVPGLAPGSDTKPYILEICADGLQSLIPIVKQVVAVAPKVPNWEIVAFRQPTLEAFSIKVGDMDVSTTTTLFEVLEEHHGIYEIRLLLPLPTDIPKEHYSQIGFLLLDHSLGEYIVMTRIGGLEFVHASVAGQKAAPLSELRPLLLSTQSF